MIICICDCCKIYADSTDLNSSKSFWLLLLHLYLLQETKKKTIKANDTRLASTMAATVQVIWPCACVRYWYRGLVSDSHLLLLFVCFFYRKHRRLGPVRNYRFRTVAEGLLKAINFCSAKWWISYEGTAVQKAYPFNRRSGFQNMTVWNFPLR